MLRDLKVNIAPMEQFLESKGVRYKMYFLLLPESAEGIDTLSAQRRDDYYLGRKVFLEQLAQRKPEWKIIEAPPMENRDFVFDSAHLRESGQTKIADLIKQQLAQGQVMKQ